MRAGDCGQRAARASRSSRAARGIASRSRTDFAPRRWRTCSIGAAARPALPTTRRRASPAFNTGTALSNTSGTSTPPTASRMAGSTSSARTSRKGSGSEPARESTYSARAGAFEVRFAGLAFAHRGEVKYQVRLVPVEQDWRGTEIHEARYTHLPPGPYTFEMRARIGTGPWSPEAATTFRILPAWWQTFW